MSDKNPQGDFLQSSAHEKRNVKKRLRLAEETWDASAKWLRSWCVGVLVSGVIKGVMHFLVGFTEGSGPADTPPAKREQPKEFIIMRIHIRQIYIRPGVSFPFSLQFQAYLADEISSLVETSAEFTTKYGSEFALTINVSAKNGARSNEIKGPTVFKRTKDVEYSVFLPFDVITSSGNKSHAALMFALDGVGAVCALAGLDATLLAARKDAIVGRISSDPLMFNGQFV